MTAIPPNVLPKLAIFKFASCDGCRLQLIDVFDEVSAFSDLLRGIDLAHFSEASSSNVEGPYEVSIIEGSISTLADKERIQTIRRQSEFLITIGACATSGGIQALRNWRDYDQIMNAVYAKPDYIDSLRDSTAIGDHVHVDFELRGCPINKEQLREVLTAYLLGKHPRIPTYSVCMECKRRGNVCIVVARNEPCLGPITQAGCGAICPTYGRGCYGCFGVMEQPNMPAQINMMREQGMNHTQIGHALRAFAHEPPLDDAAQDELAADHCLT